MSDVLNRDKLEAVLAKQITKLSAPALRKLIDALGDPPNLDNVPADLLSQYGDDLRNTLEAAMRDMYVEQAHTMAAEHGITASVNWTLVNQDAADWARAYSFELVKGITETTTTALQDIISRAYEDSLPLSEVQDSIAALFGADRAAAISTTELTRAAAEGEIETVAQMSDAGVDMIPIWMNREDSIVCTTICIPLDNVRGEMIDGEWQFLNPDDGEYYTIPGHPNCLVGDSLVSPVGRIAATSDRQYDGDVIVIHTASQKQLTITPNHLVLTNRGWVKAGMLDVGSHVISSYIRDDPSLCNPDNQNVPTRIQDIAESFGDNRSVVTVPVPVAGIDFHGDWGGSDVAVIKTNSLLRDDINPAGAQQVGKDNFVLRLVGACAFDIGSMFDFGFNGAYFAPCSDMGISSLIHSLGIGHARPFERFSLRITPDVYLVFDEMTADSTTADMQRISDGLFRTTTNVFADDETDIYIQSFGHEQLRLGLSPKPNTITDQSVLDGAVVYVHLSGERCNQTTIDVFLDDVISIERLPFVGHVYNLQTESNIYIADGIITHNCRCSLGWEFAT